MDRFNEALAASTSQQTSCTRQLRQSTSHKKPHVVIVEQPSKHIRFRYECEVQGAGMITGESSTSKSKTWVSIKVVGYRGRAAVVASCVTTKPPYRAHPHNLIGENCKKGVCTLKIPTDTMTIEFPMVGIQATKRKDLERSLKTRQEIRVDPFRHGFDHINNPHLIDPCAVRLCFQVFLEGSTPGKLTVPLVPAISKIIYGSKTKSDLNILKLSHSTAPVDGGKTDLIIVCQKVCKDDIEVRFFEENGDWETTADFTRMEVFKQIAIWFKTPKYKNVHVTEPVPVFIQLRRRSDGATGQPFPFKFLPVQKEAAALQRKRKIINPEEILRHLQAYDTMNNIPVNLQVDTTRELPLDRSSSSHHANLNSYSDATTLSYIMDKEFLLDEISSQWPADSSTVQHKTQHSAWNNQMTPWTSSNSQSERNLRIRSEDLTAFNISTTNTIDVNAQDNLLSDLATVQVDSEELCELLLEENVQLPVMVDDNLFLCTEEDNSVMDSIEKFMNLSIDNA